VLPTGVLKNANNLSLAVVRTEAGDGGPVPVSLVQLGNHWTGGPR
jgi:hypothetical protein